jgi:hypothetical protein
MDHGCVGRPIACAVVAFDVVFGAFAAAILVISFLIAKGAIRRGREARDRLLNTDGSSDGGS